MMKRARSGKDEKKKREAQKGGQNQVDSQTWGSVGKTKQKERKEKGGPIKWEGTRTRSRRKEEKP